MKGLELQWRVGSGDWTTWTAGGGAPPTIYQSSAKPYALQIEHHPNSNARKRKQLHFRVVCGDAALLPAASSMRAQVRLDGNVFPDATLKTSQTRPIEDLPKKDSGWYTLPSRVDDRMTSKHFQICWHNRAGPKYTLALSVTGKHGREELTVDFAVKSWNSKWSSSSRARPPPIIIGEQPRNARAIAAPTAVASPEGASAGTAAAAAAPSSAPTGASGAAASVALGGDEERPDSVAGAATWSPEMCRELAVAVREHRFDFGAVAAELSARWGGPALTTDQIRLQFDAVVVAAQPAASHSSLVPAAPNRAASAFKAACIGLLESQFPVHKVPTARAIVERYHKHYSGDEEYEAQMLTALNKVLLRLKADAGARVDTTSSQHELTDGWPIEEAAAAVAADATKDCSGSWILDEKYFDGSSNIDSEDPEIASALTNATSPRKRKRDGADAPTGRRTAPPAFCLK